MNRTTAGMILTIGVGVAALTVTASAQQSPAAVVLDAGMRNAVRKRDIQLQGAINPVLDSFGNASEARQYSGRAVDGDWKCPFSQHRGG